MKTDKIQKGPVPKILGRVFFRKKMAPAGVRSRPLKARYQVHGTLWDPQIDEIASNKRRHGTDSENQLHQTKGDMVLTQRFGCIKQKATWY
jgi:hypothetical protein